MHHLERMTLWQLSNGATIDVEGTAKAFPELGVLSEPKVMAAFGLRTEEADPVESLLKRIRAAGDPDLLTDPGTRAAFARILVHELATIDPSLVIGSPGVCACESRKAKEHDKGACAMCSAWLDAWD